jgi:type I restriction enzyme R subunit
MAENFRVHTLLIDGAPVEHRDADGAVRTIRVRLIDFVNPANNDWPAVNQFTVHNGKKRRPDIVAFVNGVPLVLFELKSLANAHATLKTAWNQIQTYRGDIPALFVPNAMTVISDGPSAAMSSFSGALSITRRGRRSTAARS